MADLLLPANVYGTVITIKLDRALSHFATLLFFVVPCYAAWA